MADQNVNSSVPNENAGASNNIDLVALFFHYLSHWKLFIASIFLCAVLAFLYLRFQAPVYEVSSWVYINEGDRYSKNVAGSLSSIKDLGTLSTTSGFDNEMVKFKSRSLMQKVVTQLELYIKLSKPSFFSYDRLLYKDAPLHVYMTPQEAEKLRSPIHLEMDYTKDKKLKVLATYQMDGEEIKLEKEFTKLPAALTTHVGVITISSTEKMDKKEESVTLSAVIARPSVTAMALKRQLEVRPYSKRTTVAIISINSTIPQLGVDLINSLVTNYNSDTNDEKNEVAQKTAEFIQDRIGIINGELGSTETRLAEFKRKSGLTDLTSDARLALEENSKYEQQRTENATQIRLVQFLRNYIFDPKNKEEALPANVGLKDPTLIAGIDQYNNMVIERKRLLRTSSEDNPAVIHLNAGLEAMHHNLMTTVTSVLKGLEITQADIAQQASKFETRISNAPTQEKEFMSISRQQEIQAALYIMLLQKREENAIKLAATAKNGRIIETPMAGLVPVAPKKKVILLASLFFGLCLPIGFIFIYDLTRYKIEGRKDVEKITKLPIIAEIPLSKIKPVEGTIILRENKNDLMEETFRSFRTNLLFMLEKNEKVILFTSTIPGEGKSFISGNLAVSMAYLGKKVLVMGMDIRKPGLNKVFNVSKHAKGITDYLADSEHYDLFSLIQHSDISENLDILVGGTIPPNPTELVARDILVDTIEQLKKQYDYLLLDTAPIAVVTDTSIISRVADMCVYVCRADVTAKSDLEYINQLNQDKKFDKLGVVINGLDFEKRDYGYNYGYGKYGYGKKYGYGSYGYGDEAKVNE